MLFKHVFASIKDFWESLKETIESETIKFSKAKNRGLSRDKVLITNRLIKLKNLLVSGDTSVQAEIRQLESLLKSLFTRELDGCKIRSRAKWIEEGEAPTRIFLSSSINVLKNQESIQFMMQMTPKSPLMRKL